MVEFLGSITHGVFIITGTLISLTILGLVSWSIFAYWADRHQVQHTVRRNFPVIGRFRYVFEHLGEFFRQYFFAQDREELPFNRAERSWVYRAAKGISTTIAFGSTKRSDVPGSVLFLNSPFPVNSNDHSISSLVFGPYCKHPYHSRSIINISGMSYGAISAPAIEALARGAAQSGCWLNTGEGGLSPYHDSFGADIVFQIGTAKYGVRTETGQLDNEKLKRLAEKSNIKMFEIKLSQGAKPGKGGMLPAAKISAEVATIRGIPENKDSFSPNAHPEIQSVSDLLDFIHQVRTLTNKPTGIKLVLGDYSWLECFFTEITQRGIESAPDFITLDGAEGGTGAAPQALMDSVGLPLAQSLPILVDFRERFGLQDRIRIVTSGKLITPERIGWALAAGADAVTSARGFMFALGCIQALQCNKNTCPTGITTHDHRLQRGLVPTDKGARVSHYVQTMHEELAILAHSCGVENIRKLTPTHCRIIDQNGLPSEINRIPVSNLYDSVRPNRVKNTEAEMLSTND